MKDPFFADIDWDALARKELEPPQQLSKNHEIPSSKKQTDDELMLFEKDEQRAGEDKKVFDDEDYSDSNKNY